MKQKKVYDCPKLLLANMNYQDMMNISGDPSMEDVEWASSFDDGGAL